MKSIFILFLALFLYSCSIGKNDSTQNGFNDKLLDFMISSADTTNDNYVEIPFLYDTYTSEISDDSKEQLIFVQKLKSRGFEATDWSRGNHMDGPRIVSITMKKDSCECQVDKIYYSTEDDIMYRMTERIKCRKIKY